MPRTCVSYNTLEDSVVALFDKDVTSPEELSALYDEYKNKVTEYLKITGDEIGNINFNRVFTNNSEISAVTALIPITTAIFPVFVMLCGVLLSHQKAGAMLPNLSNYKTSSDILRILSALLDMKEAGMPDSVISLLGGKSMESILNEREEKEDNDEK